MAKLKAPLMSFGASGAIAKAIVYFPWKGLDVAREYVVPANPQTTAQTTQRGYMTSAVAEYHSTDYDADDKTAWDRLAGILAKPMSGFNAFCRSFIDLKIAGQTPNMGYDGSLADDGDGTFSGSVTEDGTADGVDMVWGYSKTALIYTEAGVETIDTWDCTPATSVSGRRVYARFRVKSGATLIGETGLFQQDVA